MDMRPALNSQYHAGSLSTRRRARAARAAVIVRNARNVQIAGLSIDGPAWRDSPQPFDPLWTDAVTTSQIDLTQVPPRGSR
jgi:aminopeptidase N